ncbi:cbb3-type cytochrome oxidase assembly protein CcoS [Novilysobacter defluvii]|uniref:Cytochrome oxidase maturation protein Cbb3 n=1 Tax=Lysobacter defluvii IMMIB APB-9 = DSM 18482 TaxID=1385515 RepID=A0A0A0M6S4_9GAMM|nr:cbb3-type cytochrome oxidase assembly protein CcoS [Lysobacter defluvii]KGO97732.1 cytochrome oxidase maturation protein Cbb3 [Lysobacter defluvii IMMIB APB-9 = DSM 18482]
MNILLLMIPLALVLLVAAILAFVWAVRRGQFEDLDTPAIDILREDPTERATRARVEARRAAAMQGTADADERPAGDDRTDRNPGAD